MPEFHENLTSHDQRDPPSIKAFGITFAVVLSIVGLFPLVVQSGGPRWWALGLGAAFLAAAFLAPRLLQPLNQLWFRFGMVLHRVVNPLILGLMYAAIILPTAVVLRLFGKRLIAHNFDPNAKTYWIVRDPPGPEADTMKNQF